MFLTNPCGVFSSLHSPVSKNVRVGSLPGQGAELDDRDEPPEVLDLLGLVLAVDHPRQVEQLGSLPEERQHNTDQGSEPAHETKPSTNYTYQEPKLHTTIQEQNLI